MVVGLDDLVIVGGGGQMGCAIANIGRRWIFVEYIRIIIQEKSYCQIIHLLKLKSFHMIVSATFLALNNIYIT